VNRAGLSYVVTGGGRGIGRAITRRLAGDGGSVVVIELGPGAMSWAATDPLAARLTAVTGDAANESITARAADLAASAGTFAGWVNNAAVFRDAWLHETPPATCWASSG
jgi:NAD(P)-dependent dehydrogenase (short-subunit alcohol dehydrogenase family)